MNAYDFLLDVNDLPTGYYVEKDTARIPWPDNWDSLTAYTELLANCESEEVFRAAADGTGAIGGRTYRTDTEPRDYHFDEVVLTFGSDDAASAHLRRIVGSFPCRDTIKRAQRARISFPQIGDETVADNVEFSSSCYEIFNRVGRVIVFIESCSGSRQDLRDVQNATQLAVGKVRRLLGTPEDNEDESVPESERQRRGSSDDRAAGSRAPVERGQPGETVDRSDVIEAGSFTIAGGCTVGAGLSAAGVVSAPAAVPFTLCAGIAGMIGGIAAFF